MCQHIFSFQILSFFVVVVTMIIIISVKTDAVAKFVEI